MFMSIVMLKDGGKISQGGGNDVVIVRGVLVDAVEGVEDVVSCLGRGTERMGVHDGQSFRC